MYSQLTIVKCNKCKCLLFSKKNVGNLKESPGKYVEMVCEWEEKRGRSCRKEGDGNRSTGEEERKAEYGVVGQCEIRDNGLSGRKCRPRGVEANVK